MKGTDPLSSQSSRDERDAKPDSPPKGRQAKNPVVSNSSLKAVSDVAIIMINPGNALQETPIAIIVEKLVIRKSLYETASSKSPLYCE